MSDVSDMIAGLPWTSWLLLAAAVIPGLVLQIVHHRRRLRQYRSDADHRGAD